MPAKIVPVSGESLREAAKRKMKQRSEERYLPTDPDERLYALGELLEMDFKEFNKRELDQLHGIFEVLYQDALDDIAIARQHEKEPLPFERKGYAVGVKEAFDQDITTPSGQMSKEDWCKIHRLRPDGKNKSGPKPKKKKNIFDLAPGEKGLEAKPYEPCKKMPHETEEGYLIRRELEIRMDKIAKEPPRLQGKRVNRNPVPGSRWSKSPRKGDKAASADIKREI